MKTSKAMAKSPIFLLALLFVICTLALTAYPADTNSGLSAAE
jgi:preprotein translocase subunit SecG